MTTANLSEKWTKGAIVGTIWAASEIVLGSFLHNLKVPFSGNILTAIGLIIMISISYIWTEKGLFWRAGLICAIMKTMSPSAVIFGPMIAIFTESVLLEISVRVFGRTIAGFIIGAMMAMSWNLFQKIISYIVYYGSDIIGVYSNLLKLAQKQLSIQTDIVWFPIIALLILYAFFGAFSAFIGIKTGRKMVKDPSPVTFATRNNNKLSFPGKSAKIFNYSIIWLIIDMALIITGFFLLEKTRWYTWSIAVSAIVILWSLRYKSSLRRLSKPKFWIFFVVITLLTAFVFTRVQAGENLITKGLLQGIQMNFRAVIIIVGFSVLGTELYNPVIRNFFLRTRAKNLPLAIEIAVESLPDFISSIPDFKTMARNPVVILHQVISQADRKLSEIKNKPSQRPGVIIITGGIGEGKTTFVKNLCNNLKEDNIQVGGLVAERVMKDSLTTGYDLVSIETGERFVFLRKGEECSGDTVGKFSICSDALDKGKRILVSLAAEPAKISVIDEIGIMEMEGRGWADSLESLMLKMENLVIIVVRDYLVEKVISKWNMEKVRVIRISETDPLEAAGLIKESLSKAEHSM